MESTITITPTELRRNIYRLLDDILETGIPLNIKVGEHRLQIVPVDRGDKLGNLPRRPGVIRDDHDDLLD